MADLAKDTSRASFDTSQALVAPHIAGDVYAGEDLDPVSPCHIASDGKVYMSSGLYNDADAKFDGFTGKAYKLGQAVTLMGIGNRFHYSAGTLTPGQDLFMGEAPGTLSSTATTGGTAPIARAINATDVRVLVNG